MSVIRWPGVLPVSAKPNRISSSADPMMHGILTEYIIQQESLLEIEIS